MFGKPKFLEPHIEEWQLETWGWLLRHLGGLVDLRSRRLVLPTGEFFPKTDAVGHERALVAFERVKVLIGISDWPCTLVAKQSAPMQGSPVFGLQSTGGAAGTFQMSDGRVFITYDSALIAQPYNLIATFSHECAHYRLHGINELAPGEADEPQIMELATDLAVAYLGFGVFGANAAFEFEQFQGGGVQGWHSRRSGYLTEHSWLFALAVFLALRGEDAEIAKSKLKPNLASDFGRAVKRLQSAPELLAPLKADASQTA